MQSIGKWIRKCRLERNWSQVELANELGVAPISIVNWESDKYVPQEANVRRLEDAFAQPFPNNGGEDIDDLEESGFLVDWLRNARLERNMTLHDLSEASGVSVSTIISIEQGRNLNPMPSTINKLERALGESLPKETILKLEIEAQIEGLGGTGEFNPMAAGQREWPTCAGVYVLYDEGDRPVYVGETNNIAIRMEQHRRDKWWYKEPIVCSAMYIEIEDKHLRRKVEDVVIRVLKWDAVFNVQNRSRRRKRAEDGVRKPS
ncbi:MAG: helix-turn-helix domain-containing protein [Rhodospirillales bacterium]|nr:helix-turn-helix domain-containing protein [Rhodospirillales bacterium]